jgi:histone deacetylase complex regulatory component SIN3
LENINIHYVSTQYSLDKLLLKKPYEDTIKKDFQKAPFEEELFKAEDERFEMDTYIHRFRHVLKWLEQLSDKNISEEKSEFLIEKILKFDVLQKIYEKKTDEYIAAVRKDKEGMLPKI